MNFMKMANPKMLILTYLKLHSEKYQYVCVCMCIRCGCVHVCKVWVGGFVAVVLWQSVW